MALSDDPETRVVGICAFPKSGNTWIRAIVGALLTSGRRGAPDLPRDPFIQAEEIRGFRFHKHHGAHVLRSADGAPLATSHVSHIRRNPLDVFLSCLDFLSDNVTGTAPVRFESVDAIRARSCSTPVSPASS